MDKYLNDVMLGKCMKEKKKDYSFNNQASIKRRSMSQTHHKEPNIPLGYVAYPVLFCWKIMPITWNMQN